MGMYNNLENLLKRYNIKKPDITKENKFSMIAVEHLIKILNDQTLVDHHHTVLRAIHYIVTHIGKDSIQFLPMIIPSILNWISQEGDHSSGSSTQALGRHFYDCLQTIITWVPTCISEYQSMIFDTIEQVIQQQPRNASDVITLLRYINNKSRDKYLPQMNFILPKVLQLIDSQRHSSSDYFDGQSASNAHLLAN